MDYPQESSCATCGKTISSKSRPFGRWHSTVLSALILILPKCPFCVVAYTSSMAICGAPSLVDHHTDWGAWLAIGLSLICLSSIAMNFRGNGTRTALIIAFLGMALLVAGLLIPDALGWYYAGALLLFISSFYNGRGYHSLNKLIAVLPTRPVSLPDITR